MLEVRLLDRLLMGCHEAGHGQLAVDAALDRRLRLEASVEQWVPLQPAGGRVKLRLEGGFGCVLRDVLSAQKNGRAASLYRGMAHDLSVFSETSNLPRCVISLPLLFLSPTEALLTELDEVGPCKASFLVLLRHSNTDHSG